MKVTKKYIGALLLALSICISSTVSTFATKIPTDATSNNARSIIGEYTFEVCSNGINTLYSSVGGYNQKSITSSDRYLSIDCSGSGSGGMGITIETSCSYGTYSIDYAGSSAIGSASSISGTMTTNSHIEKHNLYQTQLGQYILAFTIPSNVPSYFVKVWIYG